MGDTASDLPVLKLARVALAPANADDELRDKGVEVVPGNCQRGLARVAESSVTTRASVHAAAERLWTRRPS